MYEIKYHPLVEKDLKQLNNSIRIEVFKKIKKIGQSPLKKMYVAKKQIRIVYEIIDNIVVVMVLAIGKREDMEVYKQAEQRR